MNFVKVLQRNKTDFCVNFRAIWAQTCIIQKVKTWLFYIFRCVGMLKSLILLKAVGMTFHCSSASLCCLVWAILEQRFILFPQQSVVFIWPEPLSKHSTELSVMWTEAVQCPQCFPRTELGHKKRGLPVNQKGGKQWSKTTEYADETLFLFCFIFGSKGIVQYICRGGKSIIYFATFNSSVVVLHYPGSTEWLITNRASGFVMLLVLVIGFKLHTLKGKLFIQDRNRWSIVLWYINIWLYFTVSLWSLYVCVCGFEPRTVHHS